MKSDKEQLNQYYIEFFTHKESHWFKRDLDNCFFCQSDYQRDLDEAYYEAHGIDEMMGDMSLTSLLEEQA